MIAGSRVKVGDDLLVIDDELLLVEGGELERAEGYLFVRLISHRN